MNLATMINDADRQEQVQMLIDSAAGIAPRHGDFSRLRRLRFTRPGTDRDMWSRIAEMGWLGLRMPETAGGAGLGALEYAALAIETGAALLPEPLIEAQLAIEMMGDAAPQSALNGEEIILPAWGFAPDGLDPTQGVQAGNLLNGTKNFVPMAQAADRFLVTTADGLFLVNAGDVQIDAKTTQDGGHIATLNFTDCPATPIDGDPNAPLDIAVLACSAYLLGVTERAFEITLDYLKTREQFGRKIGSFQALQHLAVDLRIQIDITRAVIRDACLAVDDCAPDAAAIIARAKARATDAAMLVTQQSIQLHGAIGYTDETDIGLFLRKTLTICNRYGSAKWHRKRYINLTARKELA